MAEHKMLRFEELQEPEMPVRFSMGDEAMQELVSSIRMHGVLQNLVVVPRAMQADGVRTTVGEIDPALTGTAPRLYEIVAGHRRYKAAQIIGLKELPCLIFEDADLAKHAAMLDENLCREDITAAEEANLYAEIIEKYDCTEEKLLEIVHRPASYVYARLSLLKGNPAVLQAVADRQVTLSVAQQLNRVDHPDHCTYLLRLAIDGGATARTVMKWVQDYKANGPSPTVNLAPMSEAAERAAYPSEGQLCFFCGSRNYQANIVWVPIHDFERDALIQKVRESGALPSLEGQPEDTGQA